MNFPEVYLLFVIDSTSSLFKQVAAVEDILNGGEGDKFKATADIILHAQKSTDNDGKINSAACSIQWIIIR